MASRRTIVSEHATGIPAPGRLPMPLFLAWATRGGHPHLVIIPLSCFTLAWLTIRLAQ